MRRLRIKKILRSAVSFVAVLLAAGGAMAAVQPQGFGKDSDQPIEISSDSLEVSQQEKVAVFSGKVVAVQGSTTLKSDKMKVFYSGGGKDAPSQQAMAAVTGTQKISRIIAEGSVRIISEDQTASGTKGIYDVEKSLVVLTGGVTLAKGKNVLKGEKFEYDMATGKSRLISGDGGESGGQGRVKGLFVPGKSGTQ